ncbi:hypothetical protein J6590_010052 [Homalodisca vitripennis]|nr:hypothetical protein J6590_010052 [Homalodisca vitripennis]
MASCTTVPPNDTLYYTVYCGGGLCKDGTMEEKIIDRSADDALQNPNIVQHSPSLRKENVLL